MSPTKKQDGEARVPKTPAGAAAEKPAAKPVAEKPATKKAAGAKDAAAPKSAGSKPAAKAAKAETAKPAGTSAAPKAESAKPAAKKPSAAKPASTKPAAGAKKTAGAKDAASPRGAAAEPETPTRDGELRRFARENRGGWDHKQWVGLLDSLRDGGHDASDEAAVGLTLERERLAAVLEEVDGLDTKHVQALVVRFDTVYSLGRASDDELGAVAGMTPALAKRIRAATGR